jgi:type II secretory pathway component PulF
MSQRRSLFFASLARLTGAGIPVAKAGDFIRGRSRDGSSHQAVQALELGLQRGESIAQALRPSLTDLEFRMVDAAESGGRLSAGFKHLERYYALLAAARKRMRRAAAYPLVLLHAAAASAGVIAFLAGRPALPALFGSLAILWGVLLLLWLGIRAVISAAARVGPADTLLRKLPIAGSVWKNLALTRWSAVMHFHIISGQKFSTALEAAAEASGSAGLAVATRRLAARAEAGQSVAEGMQQELVFPEFFAFGFATAETTGTLDIETAQQMDACMEAATQSMDVLSEWVPRLLYFSALAFGAWQALQLVGYITKFYQGGWIKDL